MYIYPCYGSYADITGNHPVLSSVIFRRYHGHKSLGVSRCGIKDIAENTFQGMDTLVRLDLSHNKLQALGEHSLNGAVNLEVLLLNDNAISTIHKGAFSIFSLDEVNLNKNKLVKIPPELFVGINLGILRMGWNPIKQLEPIYIPIGIKDLRLVPHGDIDIESFAQYALLETLQLGQCHSFRVIWPKNEMPRIFTLELTPTRGFRDGNEILRNLALFPNVINVKLLIWGFREGITIGRLKDSVPSIKVLIINDLHVSVHTPLIENDFLKSLIYRE